MRSVSKALFRFFKAAGTLIDRGSAEAALGCLVCRVTALSKAMSPLLD